ncbi:chorismate synthase [Lactococcus garvieae subsp. garvieae]|jgi:chorismate synthase|uniref:Chorismate synthase n=3 Tax=Lactococcus garvieae TaxID=1363 RepID=F9VC72_LACGL|nr:chorismate synthase [Lactococcus garvieae]ETD04570.1 chorismate synthase [Lactococcus garvieae TRF1]MDN5628207.1 chorismate synthase [Lactococcus sp.]EIT66669.1 Chorismate synthase (5-enolpyruvylshikimate-3-phosphate phospholyase) [Lactococcus garvieae IPLA 31405]EOT31854.1 chorismate synthase [Lactococcus garvieae ATCC 49156]EOT94001.1 chorismate synthase [Lactococcus garvieae ATCC 49156]
MRFFTAGESHGPRLTAIIEGLPAGLPLQASDINVELKRRQGGYGRGGRMKIESDQVEITSGLRHGKTLGSPLTLNVTNRDFSHWTEIMASEEVDDAVKRQRKLTKPRPGHADLVGGMKYEFEDLRNTLERSSARETTMRVAVGAVAKALLKQLDIDMAYHVVNFGGKDVAAQLPELSVSEIKAKAGTNDLSIVDISRAEEIRSYIDKIKKAGDTIGGIVEVRVTNVPAGLGSYVHFDRKLDAKIAAAVVSINAFKGVEFGLGFEAGRRQGSQVMDEILWAAQTGYSRKSNNLGGFEGGMTNGEDLVIRGVMKPIPTLYKPLMSVNTETHEPYKASVERSDPTALPAAGVVMENVVATVIAQEICDKFSSDSFRELQEAFQNYKERLKNF